MKYRTTEDLIDYLFDAIEATARKGHSAETLNAIAQATSKIIELKELEFQFLDRRMLSAKQGLPTVQRVVLTGGPDDEFHEVS